MIYRLAIIAAVILFGVAAVSVFMALQRADVLAWLATAAVSAIASAVLPAIAKRMPKADEDRMIQARREGREWNPFRRRPRDR